MEAWLKKKIENYTLLGKEPFFVYTVIVIKLFWSDMITLLVSLFFEWYLKTKINFFIDFETPETDV